MKKRKIRLTEDIDISIPPAGNIFSRAEICISKGTEGTIIEEATEDGYSRPLISFPMAKGINLFIRTSRFGYIPTESN